MKSDPPTWEQYTKMQFGLERELVTAKADANKWRYQVMKLKDQSSRITWLENRVAELERQVNEVK